MFFPLRGPSPHGGFGKHISLQSRRLKVLAARALVSSSAHLRALGAGAGSVSVLAAASSGAGSAENPDEGKQNRRRGVEFGDKRRRITDSILVLNCACMMLQWLSRGMLTFWGAKVNSYIFAGQWWRLITPTFLHSGLFHLAINSFALNSLGPQVEGLSGGQRFLSIYLVSAFTGTVASVMMTPQPSLGSSGAIFGLGAALGLFYWRHKEPLGKASDSMLQQLGVTAVLNIVYSIAVKNIDNWGHLGGMLGGALVAWLLGPHLKKGEEGRWVDQPPVRWLAYPEHRFFKGDSSSSSTSSSTSSTGRGQSALVSSADGVSSTSRDSADASRVPKRSKGGKSKGRVKPSKDLEQKGDGGVRPGQEEL